MAADGLQRLGLKDLDAVLERAKAEGWTELALLANDEWGFGASRLVRSGWPAARVFVLNEPLGQMPNALIESESLTSLNLEGNKIGGTGASDIAKLRRLASLDLGGNQIGDAGVAALAQLIGLRSLSLQTNKIGDRGVAKLAKLQHLEWLELDNNQISNFGAQSLASLTKIIGISLERNRIGDQGAAALANLSELEYLNINHNPIGDLGATHIAKMKRLASLEMINSNISDSGARCILESWSAIDTSSARRYLDISGGAKLGKMLAVFLMGQTNPKTLIAAWRQYKEQEIGRAPLPTPEAAGEPVAHGLQVGTAPDGRLSLVDPATEAGARDDAIGRELHGEVILALDRLIVAAGRSNVVAEWRELAEASKERLGGGPPEVRVSAILRIERLRSLREADERRRAEPDPLVEPAEAGVAAALRDAVAAANLYVETDPYLAEQQRRVADPGLDSAISTEEAEAAEVEMTALDIADPALMAELRLGRETAAAGGRAGERALAWLAGSWRNVVREMLRQVLAWVREQVKAARASAGEAAMQAKLGAVITIDEAVEVLGSMGLQGGRAASGAFRAGGESAGRIWRHGEPVLGKAGAGVFMLWLADNVGLLTRLGWSPEFAAQIQRLLAGIAG